ncbi:MFS transporter [Planotetraspora kaengkrachanensis]|uniref:MFS transporter n=1 Tax=Planotetraspora kaengkrachanensis TaxID=575193 RepID=A0A8J3M4N2_9ACTN|nr:MFS transporter [Planotetraspora kaengkrachanensis]GIG76935.1 MFS transporter [Planotetraspora kaengkrachanensis]
MIGAPPSTGRAGWRIPRRAGFWLVGGTLLAFMAASSTPSPLYVVYQQRWHFSAAVLTAVFAVYVLALLIALLTVGGISDHVGRRPVLATALLAEAAAMVVFMAADGVGLLLLARILQGLATGAAAGAISAAVVDLQPGPRQGALTNSVAPTVGLAVGALGAGLLLQYAPAPTTLPFALLAVVFVILAAAVAFLPETVSRRPGALSSLRPRASVPPQARRAFLTAVPCLVATWAMGGLYLSLGGSVTASVLHVSNHLVGGLVVTTLTGAGAVASVVVRDMDPRRVMTAGSASLAIGTALTMTAIALESAPLFFVGTAVAGSGFGAAFLGAFRSLAQLAEPAERAELFASIYVVSYLAFSVPAVLAGLAVPSAGLHDTATAYGALVLVLALLAVVAGAVARRPRQDAADGPAKAQHAPAETGRTPEAVRDPEAVRTP